MARGIARGVRNSAEFDKWHAETPNLGWARTLDDMSDEEIKALEAHYKAPVIRREKGTSKWDTRKMKSSTPQE